MQIGSISACIIKDKIIVTFVSDVYIKRRGEVNYGCHVVEQTSITKYPTRSSRMNDLLYQLYIIMTFSIS